MYAMNSEAWRRWFVSSKNGIDGDSQVLYREVCIALRLHRAAIYTCLVFTDASPGFAVCFAMSYNISGRRFCVPALSCVFTQTLRSMVFAKDEEEYGNLKAHLMQTLSYHSHEHVRWCTYVDWLLFHLLISLQCVDSVAVVSFAIAHARSKPISSASGFRVNGNGLVVSTNHLQPGACFTRFTPPTTSVRNRP